ncbi:MAG: hypothetical protein ACLVI5_09035 [Desulfovibrio piger]|jgi:hypothetical protein|uniref:hypothetical protein n=1 Tax=Desulfovibrionaceae TaxID=194924 RepID=UPI000497E09A|nr:MULTISPECIES: hypothetical protein [Desulfovibrionaceae]MCB8572903.1 hypothetical protein [Bilophila wadsworthia]MCC2715233.1 hypothetical protein [Bilophila wadsworthia]MDU4377758.1 hypothetical protein [Bilophila wadsworthia]
MIFHFIKKLLCIFVRYSLFCALLYNAVLPLVLENKVAIMICLFAKISFATGDKAMGKAQRYTMEQIQAAQKSLRGLAVKNAGKTRAETVEFLAADIRKAVEQGYSLNEIRDTLAKAGISAPLSRMKALLGQGEGGSGANGRGYAGNSGQA